MRLLLLLIIWSLTPALFQEEGDVTQGGVTVKTKDVTFLSPYNYEAEAKSYGISSRMIKLKYYC